jgi:hypothetical protein
MRSRGLLVAPAFLAFVALLGAGPSPRLGARSRPPPELGSFRVECTVVRQQRIDPIVAWGKSSRHMHDFFGNTSVVATSTYESLRAGSSNCSARGDRAAYWAPTLMTPRGDRVRPERGVFYYRNRPVTDERTVAFPRGLRMVAGGAFPSAYWTCDGESDAALGSRKATIPDCGAGGKIKAHVYFPSCWDGKHVDSPDHRSHVAYGLDKNGKTSSSEPKRCPRSHPVKIPQLDLRIVYDVSDGRDYRLSDGHVVPHADYFNAWVQRDLDALVKRCLGPVGRACGLIDDS